MAAKKQIDWKQWEPLFGTTKDIEIAKMIGCCNSTVRRRRIAQKIPAYRGDGKWKREEGWEYVPFVVSSKRDKRLWLEVLERAWKDLIKTTRFLNNMTRRLGNPKSARVAGEIRNDGQVRVLHEEVVRWFESDVDEPGSFVWVCNVLDHPDLRYRPTEIRQQARSIVAQYKAVNAA